MITDQYAINLVITELNQELNDKCYAEEIDNVQKENEIIDDIQSLFSEKDWKDKASNVIENTLPYVTESRRKSTAMTSIFPFRQSVNFFCSTGTF